MPPANTLRWWAAAEDGFSIVAASIATLRPLLSKVFPRSTIDEASNPYKRSYPLKSVSNSINMFDPGNKGDKYTTVEAGRGNCYLEGDDSDRSILNQPGEHRT
jgi:hypothetical protein